ncbi:recombinase family protein [Bacillus cereus]|uniref:recombinase family protein n=1 Tax=Bacillus cereus TaxID=1396 RepID=UPI000951F47C|nr:recombinase family protein [Bacillus cereus]OLR25024.1 resolvase [Bacillus cereus]
MRKIGYVRVSSEDQNLARQMHALQQLGVAILYQEKASGADRNRPKLQKLLQDVQEGDTVWVTDLTRITRSTAELFELVAYIQKKGANLQSVKDTWLDLTSQNPYSQFLLTIMGGVNQLERDLIRMRQREGIELAKQNRKYKGRVERYHKKNPNLEQAIALYAQRKLTIPQICEQTQISKSTLYRKLQMLSVKKRNRNNIQQVDDPM